MSQYIEYVADHLLVSLIGETHFNTPNPFEWMTLISLQSKTNFFEHRVSSYSKTSSMSDSKENQVIITDDF